jgi:hypothetical protein
VACRIDFVGTVKWLGTPVDAHDIAALRRALAAVPGVEPDRIGTVMVSLSGRAADLDQRAADVWWPAEDVLAAWS